MSQARRLAAYLRDRLEERSTWGAIVAGITGAAMLPAPFSWLAIGAGVIGALVPTTSPEERL